MLSRCLLLAALTCVLSGVGAGAAQATAAARDCGRVVNPYPGTRYEGVDLRRIRGTRVSCPGARRVARRAHRKALGITPPPSGIRRFTWKGWLVTGNLRGDSDRYRASKDGKLVTWRF